MIKLGISAFYHDSAACITINGKVIAAAEEERFTKIKHDYSFPKLKDLESKLKVPTSDNNIDATANVFLSLYNSYVNELSKN